MDVSRALWISLLYFTIVTGFLSFCYADNLTDQNGLDANSTDIVSPQLGNSSQERNVSLPDSESLQAGIRTPMSEVLFSESDPVDAANTSEKKAETAEVQKTPQYNSIGDIITAKDWKALSEYTCKMKTENPDTFNDGATVDDSREKFRRFLSPDPPAPVVSSCCG